jgi:hypothetical protein
MDTQAEKLEIIKLLLETDNPEVLESINELLKKDSEARFWDAMPTQEEDVFMEETDDFDEFIKKYGR